MTKSYYIECKKDCLDMTKEIEKNLLEYGVCELGPGKFYVSGIRMPDGTSIFGAGAATKIILMPEIECGAAIILGSFCTVKNLCLCGCEEKITLPDTVGKRHGILFKGDARETRDFSPQPKHSIIGACFISAFSGGGITCDNTGYSPRSSITASNCHIFNCGAGINISFFSEYHEFTNILSTENLYGCINNGGNNVFMNCGFNSNVTGFIIDNSDGKANNQAHGSAIGCTFNHSDGNKGIGISVIGAKWGYVFSGCQLHYSRVIVENSTNISFNNFNVGREHSFEIKGGNLTALINFTFLVDANIKIEENDKVKIINCYTTDGKEVVI